MTGLKLRLETHLLDESVVFYREYLGMTVLESWRRVGNIGAILGVGASLQGEAFLELVYTEAPKIYEGISLQFRVEDLAASMERLAGRVELEGPKARPWGSTYLYLKDPNGIQVILYEGRL